MTIELPSRDESQGGAFISAGPLPTSSDAWLRLAPVKHFWVQWVRSDNSLTTKFLTTTFLTAAFLTAALTTAF